MRTLILAVLLSSAAHAADSWSDPFPGVKHLHRTGAGNLNVHVAIVDLCAAGVGVRHTAFDERAQRTSAFAQSVGAQLAINADFSCRPVDVGPNSPFPPCQGHAAYTTYGVAAHAGQPWPNTLSLDALLAFGADRVEMFDDADDQPFAPWMSEVVGGHFSIVHDGVLNGNDCPIDPRSMIGLSKDKQRLFLGVADGRSTWRGMTCMEMGQLLIDLGADRAFGLDSGGSTTMWMEGQGVLNHPSDGNERVVGSHLAIFARGAGRPAFCTQAPTTLNPSAPMPTVSPTGPAGRFTAVTPVRLFDTRAAETSVNLTGLTRDGDGRIASATTFGFQAFAAFGVPANATGVTLNLASDDAAAPGFATAWPGHLAFPPVSTVNYALGHATSNTTTLGLDSSQRLSLFTQSPTQLLADLQGYFGPTGSGFVPFTPQRLVDTRSDGSQGLQANVPRVLVPPQAGNPEAMVLDLVATEPKGPGYVTVYPCGQAVPNASNVNFGAAETVAASASAKMGPQGVCAISSVDTHLVVDAMGQFTATGGLGYQAVAPIRLVDTRNPASPWVGRTTRATPLELKIQTLPALPADTRAVALNVTATDILDDGYVGVFPCASGWPGTSNLNYRYGQTAVANAVLVGTGGGSLCAYSSGRVHLIIDLTGVFTGAQPPPVTVTPAPAPQNPAPPPPPPPSCAEVPAGAFSLLAAIAVVLRSRRRRSREV